MRKILTKINVHFCDRKKERESQSKKVRERERQTDRKTQSNFKLHLKIVLGLFIKGKIQKKYVNLQAKRKHQKKN